MKRIIAIIALIIFSYNINAQNFSTEINEYRDKYKKDFLRDENSPLKKKDIEYLRFFEPDSTYRVTADFTKTNNATPFDLPTSNGKSKKYVEYGKLRFKLKDNLYSLT